jgi:hypothetical protein
MRTALAIFILVFAAFPAAPQQARGVVPNVSDATALMSSAKWIERSKGFEEAATLFSSGKQTETDTETLRLGLIQLLATETAASHDATTIVSGADQEREAYGNYRGDLIAAVADLKDARAIPALLAVSYTGRIATRGVAHFGKAALDPVLQQVDSPDEQLAEGAFFVIVDMLEYHMVRDPDSLTRIKNALHSALARPDESARECAMSAIEYLDDRAEFVPTLRDLARSDPHKVDGQVAEDGQDGGVVYPVRRMARALLTKIANHEAPIVDREVHPWKVNLLNDH